MGETESRATGKGIEREVAGVTPVESGRTDSVLMIWGDCGFSCLPNMDTHAINEAPHCICGHGWKSVEKKGSISRSGASCPVLSGKTCSGRTACVVPLLFNGRDRARPSWTSGRRDKHDAPASELRTVHSLALRACEKKNGKTNLSVFWETDSAVSDDAASHSAD